MIIGIGNRRHIANAVKFVFITAVAVTAGIHEIQQTPSHKLEFRHVTPGVYVPVPIPPNQLVISTISDLVQPLVVELNSDEQKREDYDG